MSAYLKFYDNETSLEVGTNMETGNVFFETRNDDDSHVMLICPKKNCKN